VNDESTALGPAILETFNVSSTMHKQRMVLCGVLSLSFLVAYAVCWLVFPQGALGSWMPAFLVLAGVFAVPTLWLWNAGRRKMLIVRSGTTTRLIVEGELEITFPLVASGSQWTQRGEGAAPLHRVYLKLIGADGTGVLLEETRGLLDGPQPDWFTTIDPTVCIAYDLAGPGWAKAILNRVERLNLDHMLDRYRRPQ
jgi:hypothetical protein